MDLALTADNLGTMLFMGRQTFVRAESDFVCDIRMGLFILVIDLTRQDPVLRRDVVDAILEL